MFNTLLKHFSQWILILDTTYSGSHFFSKIRWNEFDIRNSLNVFECLFTYLIRFQKPIYSILYLLVSWASPNNSFAGKVPPFLLWRSKDNISNISFFIREIMLKTKRILKRHLLDQKAHYYSFSIWMGYWCSKFKEKVTALQLTPFSCWTIQVMAPIRRKTGTSTGKFRHLSRCCVAADLSTERKKYLKIAVRFLDISKDHYRTLNRKNFCKTDVHSSILYWSGCVGCGQTRSN